jgi:hypothetical protein
MCATGEGGIPQPPLRRISHPEHDKKTTRPKSERPVLYFHIFLGHKERDLARGIATSCHPERCVFRKWCFAPKGIFGFLRIFHAEVDF